MFTLLITLVNVPSSSDERSAALDSIESSLTNALRSVETPAAMTAEVQIQRYGTQ